MSDELNFLFYLLVSGVSIGMMYSLIALGFVLVNKATDAINFAQGEFVMLAGFMVATLLGWIPLWAAIVVGIALMVGFSFVLEKVVLRPMLGRPVVAVIMATIGLAAILRGLPPITVGADTRTIPLPIGDSPVPILSATLPPIQVLGVIVAILSIAACTWFFAKSRMGVAMRAVADNQQVAMAMGINVERYFAIAWAMAGIVAALGGIIWGSMLGVDTQIAVVGLKVFPVVILGGLDSIIGCVVGGLIIGVVESIAAGYLDPLVGGGTKDFAPYVVMIITLMFKPYGLFGKHRIERI
ncbi:MAG: branched-chain amino acid ABC transporter permease [Hyphomicrobiaceae bacterium]